MYFHEKAQNCGEIRTFHGITSPESAKEVGPQCDFIVIVYVFGAFQVGQYRIRLGRIE